MKAPAKFALILGTLLVLAIYGIRQMGSDDPGALQSSGPLPTLQDQPSANKLANPAAIPAETSQPEVAAAPERQVLESNNQMDVVRGKVVNEEGEPVPEFKLIASFRPNAKRGTEWQERELGPFHGGYFELANLEKGYWRIKPQSKFHRSKKRASFKTPYKGKELVLLLTREAQISGLVLLPNQTPATKATVHLSSGGQRTEVDTDDQGHFLFSHLPGAFECLARDEVFASSFLAKGTSSVMARQELTLQLRNGGSLAGQVLDSKGEVQVGWRVDVRSLSWEREPRDSMTDADGRFEFAHLSPGEYWVEATLDFSKRNIKDAARAVIDITSGEVTEVILGGINPEAIKVHGRVFLDGEPTPEMAVIGKLEGSRSFTSSFQVITDAEGKFEYELPGSGPGHFLVIFEEGRLCPIPVTFTAERIQEIDIHVPAGTISGRVVQTQDKKRRKLKVTCTPEDRSPLHTSYIKRTVPCDDDGSFTFDHLPAGSYRVGVAKSMQANAVIDDVWLDPNGDVSGIELRTGETAKVEVLVLDSAGSPVAGAEVFAQNQKGLMLALHASIRTSSSGRLKLKHLGEGNFHFFARHGDEASPLSSTVSVGSHGEDPIRLTLEKGARGVIQVMDAGRAVPARLWIVNSRGDDFSSTLQTFDLNRYIREGNNSSKYDVGPLPPGTYKVRARVQDGRTVEGEFLLSADAPNSLTLQL